MNKFIILLIAVVIFPYIVKAQEQVYSLNDCINYAWENSTTVDRANNSMDAQSAYLEQAKASRLPNLQLGANQQFSSSTAYNVDNSWEQIGNSSFSTSLSSQITLYNGAKLKNSIHQSEINYNSSQLDIQTEKELISLDILSTYIEVLLAKDNVKNNQLQLDATQEQLTYAEARKEAGTIALTDLLNIKSQLATNKTNLVQAENNHQIALVSLMQLMNMPISSEFNIIEIPVDELLSVNVEKNALNVYNVARGLQPSIKSAELNIESTETYIQIAKSDALPKLTLDGGVGTGYGSSYYDLGYGEQVSNKLTPSVGLNLSIPIFQQKKVKTQVKIAQIQAENSKLELVDQQNNLRKYIEQACTDVILAKSNYQALQEQLAAEQESYQIAAEMFKQGMVNSVDFLTSKNNLIMAENQFTQAKYTLVLQNEIVEYYMGNNIAL